MAPCINPEKVEKLLKRLDEGTLSAKDRAQIKKMIEGAVRLGIVKIRTDHE